MFSEHMTLVNITKIYVTHLCRKQNTDYNES